MLEKALRLNETIESNLKEMDLLLKQVVQVKKGVHVYKVSRANKSYYFKFFEHDKDALEIACYQALNQVGVKTIQMLDSREKCLLLVDATNLMDYRLGRASDFLEEDLIDSMGTWFREIHAKHVKDFEFLPIETYIITRDQINSGLSSYGPSRFFSLLDENRGSINAYFDGCGRVVSHGDFYWKNFFVDESTREVIMFDFNYMTRGLASEEINLIRRNLRAASPDSEARFLNSYGNYDQLEYSLYEIYRHMSCLIGALDYDQVPLWAEEFDGFVEGYYVFMVNNLVNP